MIGTAKGLHICRISENCLPQTRTFLSEERTEEILSKCEGEIQRDMGDKCFFNVQMITVQWRSAQEKEIVLRKYLSVDIAKKRKSTMSL